MTRARKRVILIIVDIILLSISQGISKFFLAKYVGITDLSFVSILMGIIVLYLTFATHLDSESISCVLIFCSFIGPSHPP